MMLDNVTQKEVMNEEIQTPSGKQEEILSEIGAEIPKNNISKQQKKQGFNIKNGIITSILLKKKEDI